jgi:hypothetical protein
MKYPNELVRLYSRVLRSLQVETINEDIDEYINHAKCLDLFIQDDVIYNVRNSYNKEELERSFFIYLKQCCLFYYLILDYKKTKKILNMIRKRLPMHYNNDRDLIRIYIRLPMVRILRKMPKRQVSILRELRSTWSRRYWVKR